MRKLFILLLLALPCHGQMLQAIVSAGSSVTTKYYGYGCTTGCATQGSVTVGSLSSAGFGYNTLALGMTFTTDGSATHTATACGVNFKAADGTNPQFQCAIYTNSGTLIAAKVCTSAADATASAGWIEGPLPNCSLSASTAYWVVVQIKATGTGYAYDDPGSGNNASYYNTFAFPDWQATSPGSSNTSKNFSFYAKVTQ